MKLQALVRGYLVRKRAAATLRSMQALIRAQTAVRSQRARNSINSFRFAPELQARKSIVRKYSSDILVVSLLSRPGLNLNANFFSVKYRKDLMKPKVNFIARDSRLLMIL